MRAGAPALSGSCEFRPGRRESASAWCRRLGRTPWRTSSASGIRPGRRWKRRRRRCGAAAPWRARSGRAATAGSATRRSRRGRRAGSGTGQRRLAGEARERKGAREVRKQMVVRPVNTACELGSSRGLRRRNARGSRDPVAAKREDFLEKRLEPRDELPRLRARSHAAVKRGQGALYPLRARHVLLEERHLAVPLAVEEASFVRRRRDARRIAREVLGEERAERLVTLRCVHLERVGLSVVQQQEVAGVDAMASVVGLPDGVAVHHRLDRERTSEPFDPVRAAPGEDRVHAAEAPRRAVDLDVRRCAHPEKCRRSRASRRAGQRPSSLRSVSAFWSSRSAPRSSSSRAAGSCSASAQRR